MLKILVGTDWVANRDVILDALAQDVANGSGGRILMVPEQISHDTERRLCKKAGDTTSRYAEVLTFTRLARRVADAAGYGAVECLDEGGRVVAMASAARQLHSKLKAYASVETRPEFLSGLVDAVDEFKRCCICADDLQQASRQTEGSLAQKLEELALIFETYDTICARGKRDPRDQMTWLLEQLEESSFGEEHVFYIDGFPDFTRQHMAILEYLIRVSPCVVIALNCDRPGSDLLAFEKAGQTAMHLLQCAKRLGVEVQMQTIAPRDTKLSHVTERLFQGSTEQLDLGTSLQVYRTQTVYQECLAAAERIIELVQDGARYRDIGVVCSDIATYRSIISMTFHRCGIPVYLSGTEDILEKKAVTTVLSAMEAALGGFDQKDVLRYLRSALSPLDMQQYDRLENYVMLWSISGSRWLRDWEYHPGGLNEEWDSTAERALSELNLARRLGIEPLMRLHDNFSAAKDLRGQVEALYQFLEEISLSERLGRSAQEFDSRGDNRNAQILNQLWEILLTAMEQMHDVLGETIWDAETFTRLFKLLLSRYDVGTIPPVLDAVTVGPVSAMRCQQTEHLLVLGALEGNLPSYGASSGVLTDQERTLLRQMGVPLLGGSLDVLQTEFMQIYGAFRGADQSVTVSCPSGQPSFLYRRLCDMAGGESAAHCSLGAALTDRMEAGAYLARWDAEKDACALGLDDIYREVIAKRTHVLGTISPESIRKLYGSKLNLSASQVDRQADCRLSYFLKYGIRARERKPATIDPSEFGTYVHWVLENTVREIMGLGGFQTVTLEQTLEISGKYSQAYVQEHFAQLDTQRVSYLFQRNRQELEMVVCELWRELRSSAFLPVDFEVAFGDSGKLPAIQIPGQMMAAQLRGFVDRVDAWRENGQNYYRVVDYKTGKKDFDYCDVFNGIGLQMLLYLFALEQEGGALLGEAAVPAGVQYFPARAPLVSADGLLTQEEADAAREKIWKRKGLLLADDDVLWAMEPSDEPKKLPFTRRKDGTKVGDIATREQFALLKEYVFRLLGRMVDEIASGQIDPNPYTRGSSHNACAFCPYGSVCHAETVEGRRNYMAMSAQRFWDKVGKEMNTNG